MLYATLEEAYNIPSFKKPKKKKNNKTEVEVEENPNIHPYDKYDSSMIVSTDHSRTTSNNHCDPLQSPPYVFPIEEKAKKQYEEALSVMNDIDKKVESNIDDELDAYLDDDEYKEFNKTPEIIQKQPKKEEKVKIQTKKKENVTKNNNKLEERIYELAILILVALLIILMCEVIVRIAKNQ